MGRYSGASLISRRMASHHFTWPLDSNAATGMWHIRANTGDNQYRMWFHVEDFMPERMALNLTGEKTR